MSKDQPKGTTMMAALNCHRRNCSGKYVVSTEALHDGSAQADAVYCCPKCGSIPDTLERDEALQKMKEGAGSSLPRVLFEFNWHPSLGGRAFEVTVNYVEQNGYIWPVNAQGTNVWYSSHEQDEEVYPTPLRAAVALWRLEIHPTCTFPGYQGEGPGRPSIWRALDPAYSMSRAPRFSAPSPRYANQDSGPAPMVVVLNLLPTEEPMATDKYSRKKQVKIETQQAYDEYLAAVRSIDTALPKDVKQRKVDELRVAFDNRVQYTNRKWQGLLTASELAVEEAKSTQANSPTVN